MTDDTERWWSKETVAIVTGGNKGIGFEIVRELARKGVITVLTARDEGRGKTAIDTLKAEGLGNVLFCHLDVTSAASAEDLATWVNKECGGVDILINNAAIGTNQKRGYEVALSNLETNYYGVKKVTKALLPLLRPGARIVNISSRWGQLQTLSSASLREKLGDVDSLTEELVDSCAIQYLDSVKDGRSREEGWGIQHPHYGESKLFLNAYTRALAKSLSSRPKDQKIFVNVVHPGFTSTDMTRNHPSAGTLEEGADTPVWLALLPEEKYPQGEFFFERKPMSY